MKNVVVSTFPPLVTLSPAVLVTITGPTTISGEFVVTTSVSEEMEQELLVVQLFLTA